MLYKHINIKKFYTLKAFLGLPEKFWSAYHFSQLSGNRNGLTIIDFSTTNRQLRLVYSLLLDIFSKQLKVWLHNLTNVTQNYSVLKFKRSFSDWDESLNKTVVLLRTKRNPLVLPEPIDIGLEIFDWRPGLLTNFPEIVNLREVNKEIALDQELLKKSKFYRKSIKSKFLYKLKKNLFRNVIARRSGKIQLGFFRSYYKKFLYLKKKLKRDKPSLNSIRIYKKPRIRFYRVSRSGVKNRFNFKHFFTKLYRNKKAYKIKARIRRFRLKFPRFKAYSRRKLKQMNRLNRFLKLKNKKLNRFKKGYKKKFKVTSVERFLGASYFYRNNIVEALRAHFSQLKHLSDIGRLKLTKPELFHLSNPELEIKFPNYNLVSRHDSLFRFAASFKRKARRNKYKKNTYFKVNNYFLLGKKPIKRRSPHNFKISKLLKKRYALSHLFVNKFETLKSEWRKSLFLVNSFKLFSNMHILTNQFKRYFRSKFFSVLKKRFTRIPFYLSRKWTKTYRKARQSYYRDLPARTRKALLDKKLKLKGKKIYPLIVNLFHDNKIRMSLFSKWFTLQRRKQRESFNKVLFPKKLPTFSNSKKYRNRLKYLPKKTFPYLKKVKPLLFSKSNFNKSLKSKNSKQNLRFKLLELIFNWRLNFKLFIKTDKREKLLKYPSKLYFYKRLTNKRSSKLSMLKRNSLKYFKMFKRFTKYLRLYRQPNEFHPSLTLRYLKLKQNISKKTLFSLHRSYLLNLTTDKSIVYTVNQPIQYTNKRFNFSRFVQARSLFKKVSSPVKLSTRVTNNKSLKRKRKGVRPFMSLYFKNTRLHLRKKFIRSYYRKHRLYFGKPYKKNKFQKRKPIDEDEFMLKKTFQSRYRSIPSALIVSRLTRLGLNALSESQIVGIPLIYFGNSNIQPFMPYFVLINQSDAVNFYLRKLVFKLYDQSRINFVNSHLQLLF